MSETRVMTPEFRAAFVNVFRPRPPMQGSNAEPKYGITMLFKKGEDLSRLKQAAKQAAIDKWGPDESKWPKNLRLPFRDQGEKNFDGFEPGAVFINATTKLKPGLVDAKRDAIIDEAEFYSGCWARATVNFFAYDTAGNRGIGVGLNNIQKLRDDEPLGGGRIPPEQDFDDVTEATGGSDAGSLFD